MFGKIFCYIQLTRPLNTLISFFSIIVAGLLAVTGTLPWRNILLASLSGALTCAAGNIINDIYDIKIDRINKPKRVLPAGRVTVKEAWILYFVLSVFSLLLSALINLYALLIVLFTLVMLFIYSARLKGLILVGNITVALLTGLAFIYGGVAVNNLRNAVIPAVFAFLINFIREILKDMEDVVGDFKNHIITFPQRYGNTLAIRIILLLTCILCLSTSIPFILRIYKIEYFISVMVIVNVIFIYFLKSLFADQSENNLKRLSLVLKINMILGLVSIYLGI